MSKLKPYSNYRPVKLNFAIKLPDGWKILRGKFVFKEMNERSVDGKEQLLSVSEHKGVVPRDSINVNMFQAENYTGYKLCNPGDVVINSLWAWHRGIGVAEHRGIVSTAYSVHRLRKPKEWNYKYLTYLLRTNAYVGEYLIRSKGIWDSRLQLTGSNFQDIQIIIPPLETQNAVVAYLDRKTQQIQEFIAKKERLVELLEEQKRSVINKAITTGIAVNSSLVDTKIEWLGKVPNNWFVKKLKYITTLIADGTHVTPNYTNEGFPFLRITDIDGDVINWDEVRYVSKEEHKLLTKTRKGRKGDVLLSKNGTIGKVIEVTWDEEFSFFVSLCLLRFKKAILPKYFSYFFKSDIVFDQLNEGSKSTSVTNLHLEKIKELIIAYPIIEEQKVICKYLDTECGVIDLAISKARIEIEKAKEYQESLITQIVTGQLKVPENAKSNLGQDIDLGMVAEPNTEYHSNN